MFDFISCIDISAVSLSAVFSDFHRYCYVHFLKDCFNSSVINIQGYISFRCTIKIWNASWIRVIFAQGPANLLSIVPVSVYVLPHWALKFLLRGPSWPLSSQVFSLLSLCWLHVSIEHNLLLEASLPLFSGKSCHREIHNSQSCQGILKVQDICPLHQPYLYPQLLYLKQGIDWLFLFALLIPGSALQTAQNKQILVPCYSSSNIWIWFSYIQSLTQVKLFFRWNDFLVP